MREFKDGLYELVLSRDERDALRQGRKLIDSAELAESEASRRLAQCIHEYVLLALNSVKKNERPGKQIEICNDIVRTIASRVGEVFGEGDELTSELLLAVQSSMDATPPLRPTTPLSESALFVNANRERRIGSELATEIRSADAIEFLCPFLFWQGYRELKDSLKAHLDAGRRLRVLTSTYCGMTQSRVLEELVGLGAEVRVSYEQHATRLHAKAWYFERASGFSTAFIGSSNLSKVALTSGLEWNVRLSEVENRAVLEEFRGAFENYWNGGDFVPFEPKDFASEMQRVRPLDRLATLFAIHPSLFQKESLERLQTERDLKGRHRNLVVAATGTGKTVLAALDFKALNATKPRSLLFLAHRQEILTQARDTFRHAMGDGAFGELWCQGQKPEVWRHVFASVQSLRHADIESWSPDRFDVVIIDEFHHASESNRSYERVLSHLQPEELLGLTATPERSDGIDILHWFAGRTAVELRLWDAIARALLVPFQYFAVADGVSLETVHWRSGRYDPAALDRLYDGNDARALIITRALHDYIEDVEKMCAIGFCAGKRHARYMHRAFTEAGLRSAVVLGDTPKEERHLAIEKLKKREINVIFAVDVFNEGVDIPPLDTVLFLRPTESALLFTQQLGRGLRLHEGKRCLTVLDFVGKARREFRYDQRFRALTGSSRTALQRQMEEGFPFLPAGCSITLDKTSQAIILENLKTATRLDKRKLALELRSLGDIGLAEFLKETGIELEDFYRASRSFSEIRRLAGFQVGGHGRRGIEKRIVAALKRILHLDDRRRIAAFQQILRDEAITDSAADRLRLMLATSVLGADAAGDVERALQEIRNCRALRNELLEILKLLDDRIGHRVFDFHLGRAIPLEVHARYSLTEIMASLGDVRSRRLYKPQEGVYFHKISRCNLLFITLTKDEKDYSASTMYNDYAISDLLFHWESQSKTRPETEKGRRHVEHRNRGITPLLFVRTQKKDDRGETMPYSFLGAASLVSHQGERPMRIIWRLDRAMPTALYRQATIATA